MHRDIGEHALKNLIRCFAQYITIQIKTQFTITLLGYILEEGTDRELREMLKDRAELRPRFVELSEAYQPMDLFEPPALDPVKTAELFLDKMEDLAKTIHGKKFLYWW